MAHLPVNHRFLGVYRTVAGLCGLFVLLFGIVSLTRTGGLGFFAQDGLPSSLGLRANPAFAMISIVVGVVLLGGAIVGRNVDRWINLVGAFVFLIAGFAMMVLMQTSFNFLGFTMATCVVSFIIGLVLLTAGLYGHVGSPEYEQAEEIFRHGIHTDEHHHVLGLDNPPRSRAA